MESGSTLLFGPQEYKLRYPTWTHAVAALAFNLSDTTKKPVSITLSFFNGISLSFIGWQTPPTVDIITPEF